MTTQVVKSIEKKIQPVKKNIVEEKKVVCEPIPKTSDVLMLYKPNKSYVKQIGHLPLMSVLGMLRYAARHGDYVHVYCIANVLVENQCVQSLRRELVEFMLGSGFLMWYPMHSLMVLQTPENALPSYFANVCFDVSTTDFFMLPDMCTRRACDATFNMARDLGIGINDCAINREISELYASMDNAAELQARASTFAYAIVVGINSSETPSFDLSWLDVALRNVFFLARFGISHIFRIFDLLCEHYKFCEPYAELMPKIRALHSKLMEGKPSSFFFNRATRLILVFLIFFFFFKCVYCNRDLPAHNVIPTEHAPFVPKYEKFLTPSHSEYMYARFGNLKANLFRRYIFTMSSTIPHVQLKSIPPMPFQKDFQRSMNMLWLGKYTNVRLSAQRHFLLCRMNKNLSLKIDDAEKTIVMGPIFSAEQAVFGERILFWMNKFSALKITDKVLECVRLFFAQDAGVVTRLGGVLYINIPLSAEVNILSEAQWGTAFVRLFASLCASFIRDIGLSRDMFYSVEGKLFCAAMWMSPVVNIEKYSVEQQLDFLKIDKSFYDSNKKYFL